MAAPGRQPPAAALVIAGGRGTRLWPLSRAGHPKPLFSLDGRETLLESTIRRLSPLIHAERTFVVAAADQTPRFRRTLRGLLPARNLIAEPVGRGTAVAIAYGAAVIRKRIGAATLAVLPADHHVHPAEGLRRTLARALRLARRHAAIVVIGVKPERAEPGYGYQEVGAAVDGGFAVRRFVEKPAARQAARMVRSGRFLWNAGMFVMTTATLEDELAAHAPGLAEAFGRFASMPAGERARFYSRLNFDSFDRVVIEKSRRVLGVKARFRWYDVGSWDGLWAALRAGERNVFSGSVVALDCDGVLARADRRLMVLLGVEDLVAVDTGDAVLIARRSRSQELRRVFDELARRRLSHYL